MLKLYSLTMHFTEFSCYDVSVKINWIEKVFKFLRKQNPYFTKDFPHKLTWDYRLDIFKYSLVIKFKWNGNIKRWIILFTFQVIMISTSNFEWKLWLIKMKTFKLFHFKHSVQRNFIVLMKFTTQSWIKTVERVYSLEFYKQNCVRNRFELKTRNCFSRINHKTNKNWSNLPFSRNHVWCCS